MRVLRTGSRVVDLMVMKCRAYLDIETTGLSMYSNEATLIGVGLELTDDLVDRG